MGVCYNFYKSQGALTFSHGNRLFFGWWLKADKKPAESWRLKSRLSVSAKYKTEEKYFCLSEDFFCEEKHFAFRMEVALTESRLFSRQLSDSFLSAFSHQPKKSRFTWKKVKAPFLGLIKITFWTWKFYKCFSKIGGKFWFLKKMLNFLSFLVLLYVSGHFQQKKNFQNFSDW